MTEGTRRADMFKAWNSAFVGGDPCAHPYLKDAPGRIYAYDPPDGEPFPRYRFLPDTTTPIGLVTNAYGFRGPPVPVARQPKTIRIAFLGASTTVSLAPPSLFVPRACRLLAQPLGGGQETRPRGSKC